MAEAHRGPVSSRIDLIEQDLRLAPSSQLLLDRALRQEGTADEYGSRGKGESSVPVLVATAAARALLAREILSKVLIIHALAPAVRGFALGLAVTFGGGTGASSGSSSMNQMEGGRPSLRSTFHATSGSSRCRCRRGLRRP